MRIWTTPRWRAAVSMRDTFERVVCILVRNLLLRETLEEVEPGGPGEVTVIALGRHSDPLAAVVTYVMTSSLL